MVLSLNPMTPIIESYRDIFFYQKLPNFTSLGIVFLASSVLLYFGIKVFKKLEKGFAEEL